VAVVGVALGLGNFAFWAVISSITFVRIAGLLTLLEVFHRPGR
jgi:hypothetical protein